jgi:hypothetical protein
MVFYFQPKMARTAKKITPDYQDESVSTGRIMFTSQSLPQNPRDENFLKLDLKSLEWMRADPETHAAIEFLLDAMLSDGIETVGAVFESDPNFAEAEEYARFIRCQFHETCKTFNRSYKELLRGAFTFGHKVGEIVCRLQTEGEDAGRLVLDRIKPKPNRSTAFVVDEFFNVLGLVGVRRGQTAITTGQIAPENVIPTEKFLIPRFEEKDADPRGVPQIRAAFDSVCDKSETRQQFKIWRKKCSIRSFIAMAGENAKPIQIKNTDDTIKLDSNGVPVTKTPLKAISETLSNMQNDTVAAFNHGTTIEPLESDGTGEQFERSYKINNQEIRKAILLQSGATGEADKGGLGKAGKEVDERVLNRRVNSFRRDREKELYQLARTLIALNFGADKAYLTPSITLGDAEKSDFSALLAAYGSVGYALDSSQFPEIDTDLGLPKRDAQNTAENLDQGQNAAAANQQTDQNQGAT